MSQRFSAFQPKFTFIKNCLNYIFQLRGLWRYPDRDRLHAASLIIHDFLSSYEILFRIKPLHNKDFARTLTNRLQANDSALRLSLSKATTIYGATCVIMS